MGYPSFDEALIYKSRTIQSQIRAAVELDYPVFNGSFHDDFNGAGLPDSTRWFVVNPSWGLCTQWVGALWVGTTAPGISPAWVQSRHNLAFPLRRDTDWTFQIRTAAATITGFGAFIRICGRSFRDAEAIFAIKANLASGLEVHAPDGFFSDTVLWANGIDTSFNRYRVRYDHAAQTYIIDIDADDDGTYEIGPFVVPVAGRYADAIVIGNSTAIQGTLGAWTEWHTDWVDVQGVAESVEDPEWAAPFTYDGTRFSYLPTLMGGRVNIDKQNLIDAAELELDNFGLNEEMDELPQLYTWMRFLNRRCLIEARAGDGDYFLPNWEILFDGKCAEKTVQLSEGGICTLSVPIRDRWRATADDMEVIGCYSDAGVVIPGVSMNMTVQEIIEDIYQQKCGLAAASHNILATPNNIPRNYNIFRVSGQQAVKTIADHAALAIYQRRTDARIEVQEWPWGTDTPGYHLSTAEEIRFLEWAESAFDVTSGEQLGIQNTNNPADAFTAEWPPHREPFYGRLYHEDAVACQTAANHDARPITALRWWARNRSLGGITVTALCQFWLDHNLEIGIKDDRFLGFGRGEYWMVDGWEHSWRGGEPAVTRIRLINLHPDRFLRQNLMP